MKKNFQWGNCISALNMGLDSHRMWEIHPNIPVIAVLNLWLFHFLPSAFLYLLIFISVYISIFIHMCISLNILVKSN